MNARLPETVEMELSQALPKDAGDMPFHVDDTPIDLAVYKVEDWLSVGFFWLLGGVVFYQFFTRYVLNDSASWTEEIARYLLIAVVFVGAAVGVRRNNHVQVDFAYRFLPAWIARSMATLVDVARISFLVTASVLTALLINTIGATRMAVIDLPMGIVYSVVLAGFVLMTWRAIEIAIRHWRHGVSVLENPEVNQ
jgi:TRAP-type C4-dicarboxylate transport system permease small subunit